MLPNPLRLTEEPAVGPLGPLGRDGVALRMGAEPVPFGARYGVAVLGVR